MTEPHDKLSHDVLHSLLVVARHLSASTSITDILSVIINAMRDTLGAERATVFEYDPACRELFSTVAHGLGAGPSQDPEASEPELQEIRIPADTGLAGECASELCIINVTDAYSDPRFNPAIDKQTGFRTRSILTFPLTAQDGELVGVAQVLNKKQGSFDTWDEEIAGTLASLAAVAIKRARLIEDQLVRQKLERDLQLARQIQQSTFPAALPRLAGFAIDAWSEPAEETGGDAYDVFAYQPRADSVENRAVLLVADATGHGVGAALSVTEVRAMLRMAVRIGEGAGLPGIAHHMNQQLCDDLPPGRFVTAWVGELSTTDHTLKSFSAGQAPLIRYRAEADQFDTLDADTLPFGVTRELEATQGRSFPMSAGDIFAVISDGIFEAADAAGRQFGTDGVLRVIGENRTRSPTEMLKALKEAVAAFTGDRPADDDRTAIVIKRV